MHPNQKLDHDGRARERLLVLLRLEPAYLEQLARDYDVHVVERGVGLETLPPDALRGIRAVLTSGPVGFSRALFDTCPDVQAVISFGTGTDRIDWSAARDRGALVANGGGANAPCVAEHAVALLLSLVREIPQLHAHVVDGGWRPGGTRHQISGKRLGIIGLGAIGAEVARMAGAFRMEIGYMTRSPRPDQTYRYFADARELAAFADAIVVACPGGRETYRLVDAEVLSALGPRGFLVNVARGSVVDTAALVRALQGREIAGAALDVFDDEPEVPVELRALENVVLTPHVAGNSDESRAAAFARAQANLGAFFAGRPMPGAVAIHHPE
jgi:lactate dehydrogenase-like 2-hydroxyacid dehydrogenase